MQEFTTFVLLEDLSPFPILYRCSKNVTIDYKYISGCAHTRGKVVRCCHHDGVANWLVKPLSRKEGKLCNCRVCSCFTLQPHTFLRLPFTFYSSLARKHGMTNKKTKTNTNTKTKLVAVWRFYFAHVREQEFYLQGQNCLAQVGLIIEKWNQADACVSVEAAYCSHRNKWWWAPGTDHGSDRTIAVATVIMEKSRRRSGGY